MKLYWAPQTRSARVLWMLEELGLEYELIEVNAKDAGAFRPEEMLDASPMGKVPALVDGDTLMADSAAICVYLADKYSSGSMAPAVAEACRGKFLYWMMYVSGVIEPAMKEKFEGWETMRAVHGWGDAEIMIKALENSLQDKEWLVGGRFTAADVMVGAISVYLRQFEFFGPESVLNAYVDRCTARPAYARAQEIESQHISAA